MKTLTRKQFQKLFTSQTPISVKQTLDVLDALERDDDGPVSMYEPHQEKGIKELRKLCNTKNLQFIKHGVENVNHGAAFMIYKKGATDRPVVINKITDEKGNHNGKPWVTSERMRFFVELGYTVSLTIDRTLTEL